MGVTIAQYKSLQVMMPQQNYYRQIQSAKIIDLTASRKTNYSEAMYMCLYNCS